MGLLKVSGTVEIGQFWPDGESDADTAKVILQTDRNSFEYQPHSGAPFAVTRIFENARVKGAATKPPIDKKGRITIRLQGIDAPELHFRPTPVSKNSDITEEQRSRFKQLNQEYRQYFGETAAVKLYNLLKQAGKTELPCIVTSAVNEPNEVFDTYARFIGDIWVEIKGKKLNVNHWLVQEGWAFPTFYATMSDEEINSFLTAAKKGRRKRNNIWKQLQDKIGQFDDKLVYRKKGAALNPAADIGPVIMPKLFRRLCTWSVYRESGISKVKFLNFLAGKKDACFITKEFLEQGAHSSTPHFLSDLIQANGNLKFQPQDLVFQERPSKLIGPDGKKITGW